MAKAKIRLIGKEQKILTIPKEIPIQEGDFLNFELKNEKIEIIHEPKIS
jgi:hypothetical protein